MTTLTLIHPSDEHTASILLVEDDEHVADALRFILERQDYAVAIAPDGRIAKQLIEDTATPPDLILLDIMLPYVDGFELIRVIRGEDAWAKTPILVLSVKSMEQDIVRALDAGAEDYIVKPFQPEGLLARVRRYLREPK